MKVIVKIGLFMLMIGGVSYWLLSKLRIKRPQPAATEETAGEPTGTQTVAAHETTTDE